jgi:hypothetical protein
VARDLEGDQGSGLVRAWEDEMPFLTPENEGFSLFLSYLYP